MDRELFVYLYTVSIPLIPVIIGGYNYAKISKSLKYLYFFVVLGALAELSNFLMSKVFGIHHNMPIGNVYFFFAFLLLGLYFKYLYKGFIQQKYIVTLIVVYEVCFVANLVFIQSISEYPALLKGIGDLMVLSLVVVFFHKTMLEAKHERIWQEPLIYINLAILLYFSGSLFYSILFNLVIEYAASFAVFSQNYFYVLNGVFYLLIARGFWKAGKQKVDKGNRLIVE